MEDSEPGINQWLEDHGPVENHMHHMEIETGLFVGLSEDKTGFAIELSTCFPNPASTTTNMNLTLQRNTNVSISLVNILGQSIKEFPSRNLSAGNNPITIDVSDLNSGIYYCSVKAGDERITKKIIVQK